VDPARHGCAEAQWRWMWLLAVVRRGLQSSVFRAHGRRIRSSGGRVRSPLGWRLAAARRRTSEVRTRGGASRSRCAAWQQWGAATGGVGGHRRSWAAATLPCCPGLRQPGAWLAASALCSALMARSGRKSRLATAATRSMQGVGALGKALLQADDGDASGRRVLPWKRPSICSLPLRGTFFLGVKSWPSG
jgi:hypothetical protein